MDNKNVIFGRVIHGLEIFESQLPLKITKSGVFDDEDFEILLKGEEYEEDCNLYCTHNTLFTDHLLLDPLFDRKINSVPRAPVKPLSDEALYSGK